MLKTIGRLMKLAMATNGRLGCADRAQENGDGIPARTSMFETPKAPYAPLRQAQGRLRLTALFTGMDVRGGDEGGGEGPVVGNPTRYLLRSQTVF